MHDQSGGLQRAGGGGEGGGARMGGDTRSDGDLWVGACYPRGVHDMLSTGSSTSASFPWPRHLPVRCVGIRFTAAIICRRQHGSWFWPKGCSVEGGAAWGGVAPLFIATTHATKFLAK